MDGRYGPALRSLCGWRCTMPPIAPPIRAFWRACLPHPRGASAHTCERDAYSCQRLCEFACQRFHVMPSALVLEQIDAPLGLDCFAYGAAARGHRPTTRKARLAAVNALMHVVASRVPALLEQVRRVLARPAPKTDQPLIPHLS